MGFIVIAILCIGLLSGLWGPSIYVYVKKLRNYKSKYFIVFILVAELIAAVLMVVVADFVGLLNPGGYILASFAFVSVAGFIYLSLCKEK